MASSLLIVAVDREHDLPVPAFVIGLLIFAVLCALILAVLMFGKGRPHS
jgi:hypothetical protein